MEVPSSDRKSNHRPSLVAQDRWQEVKGHACSRRPQSAGQWSRLEAVGFHYQISWKS